MSSPGASEILAVTFETRTDDGHRVNPDLAAWGWDDTWASELATLPAEQRVGRVVEQHRDRWVVQGEAGPLSARLPKAAPLESYPVVGDWVVMEPGPFPADPWSILAVLPRRSRFSRAAAGTGTAEQVLAANVDRVWIVHGLDRPVNPRRLERYLAVAWESGAAPEVVLTKSDLTTDPEVAVAAVQQIALGVSIWLVSTVDDRRLDELRASLAPGRTIALLGPSGVGKSTLVNALAETELAGTGPVRVADHKGRHTTTRRELFQITGGALLLDTPGIRELRVWDLDEGLDHAFPEIEELAQHCRYRDCRHDTEPGCAVTAAAERGTLDPARLDSFRKLLAEAAFQQRKTDPLAREALRSAHKSAMKTVKKFHPKYRDGR
ncbi:MAG: ribosome small subunit-dependent GTPase A [Gemmatimonadales bacterium]